MLTPWQKLLDDWKKGRISWEEYERRFRVEMGAPKAIAEMGRRVKRG